MRNLIIAVAVIAGLVLAGIGVKYGWDLLRRPVIDAGIDAHMPNGKMDGPTRENFIKSSIAACAAQRPASMDEEKFKQACACVSEKTADLLTTEDAKIMSETGKLPESLLARMQAPMKQCAKEAGLPHPAQ